MLHLVGVLLLDGTNNRWRIYRGYVAQIYLCILKRHHGRFLMCVAPLEGRRDEIMPLPALRRHFLEPSMFP